MRLTLLSSVVCSVLSGLACATSPTISDADITRGQDQFPGLTRARLEAGQQTYQTRCGACHEAYLPSSRSPHQWELAVAQMSERAHLDRDNQQLVLEYLTTFAR
jgi:cytochrome c553